MLGVAAIVGVNLHGASALPIVEVGLVAVCYAVGPLILQRYLAHLPAMGVIAASLALTAVIYLPIAALSLPHEMPSAAALGAVAGLAVVCTALAFVVFFALIGEIGAVRATVITYVNPAVAAILGVLVGWFSRVPSSRPGRRRHRGGRSRRSPTPPATSRTTRKATRRRR